MKRPATFEISTKSVAIDIATQMSIGSEKHIVAALIKTRPNDGMSALLQKILLGQLLELCVHQLLI